MAFIYIVHIIPASNIQHTQSHCCKATPPDVYFEDGLSMCLPFTCLRRSQSCENYDPAVSLRPHRTLNLTEHMRTRRARLEERPMSPEGCQAEPWNRDCDMVASRMAHCALVGEDMTTLKALEGMNGVQARSPAGNQATKFTECIRDSMKEAGLEGWTHAGNAMHAWGQAGKKRAFNVTHMPQG